MSIYSHVPRINLGYFPTPLVFLKRLSSYLGGPAIYMKRDDCTGFATGGNKVRKLEFLLADALELGCDTIITQGGMQSNHARQTAAAAAAVGLKCILVLNQLSFRNDSLYQLNGNVLLDHIFGAKLHVIPATGDINHEINLVYDNVIKNGGKPYRIPLGGSNKIGALGYIVAAEELYQQCQALNLKPTCVTFPTGSGGTEAGFVIGTHLLHWDIKTLGFSINVKNPNATERVENTIQETCRLLKIDVLPSSDSYQIDDQYIGLGYGQPTPEAIDAIKIVAQEEAILLDPVYTGKAMAGMIDYIRKNRFQKNDTVIFIHTGGNVALHVYPEEFLN